MSKIKMRCNTCGKWFQSANAKEVTCPECMQKARKEKAAAKNTPPVASKPASGQAGGGTPRPVAPPPPKPKQAQGTAHWLDTVSDVKIGQPDQPRPKPPALPPPVKNTRTDGDQTTGPGSNREREERGSRPYAGERGPNYREGGNRTSGGFGGPGGYRENDYHGPGAYRVSGTTGFSGTIGQRPRQPMDGGPGRGPRPGSPDGRDGRYDKDKSRPRGKPGPGGYKAKSQAQKPPQQPKPKKEKIPPPPPFKPTDEQVKQVEERYLELATPAEFDGIRTQIAKELSMPKTAVKKIVKELRDRQQIPSWWELQTYKGSEEELARIKAAYEPHLPIPDVGVHKTIAQQLDLKPGVVYQAIKLIRQEMQLPQYNDPSVHGMAPSTKTQDATAEPEGATIEVVQLVDTPSTSNVSDMADTSGAADASTAASTTDTSANLSEPAVQVERPEEKVATTVGVDNETQE